MTQGGNVLVGGRGSCSLGDGSVGSLQGKKKKERNHKGKLGGEMVLKRVFHNTHKCVTCSSANSTQIDNAARN